MTFKEFSGWCNKRACDGCWDISTAICCIEICSKIKALPFWKRNKELNKLKDYVEKEIVQVIEKKLNCQRQMSRND